jgi:membrane protease YdiL (CAAX protease family)
VERTAPRASILAVAWAVLLAVSLLPTVVARELLGWTVSADSKATLSIVVIAIAFLATLAWRNGRAIHPFLLILLVLVAAQWVVYERVDELPVYRTWLGDPSFSVYMLAEESLNLLVALAVVAVLLVIHRDRRRFYLAKGDTSAPAERVPWLAIRPGDRWSTVGRNLLLFISLGTLAFLVIAGSVPAGFVGLVMPFLPAILVASAVNAFTEELSYKASMLSVLVEPLGRRQALLMVAAYFGIAHFYGIPYGVTGVALAAFLGWILARSMVETGGFAWAWGIHFVQDILIFSFLAVGAVSPGGG